MKSTKAATIWSSYGPYHISRAAALATLVGELHCLSYNQDHDEYPFFDERPSNHIPIHSSRRPGFAVAVLGTLRLLWRQRYDFVFACGYETPETLASLIYRLVRRWRGHNCTVLLMAENKRDDRPRRAVVEWIKSRYVRCFDFIIVGGRSHESYFRHLGVSGSRMITGYDCVDNLTFDRLATKFRFAPPPVRGPYFLSLGRLVAKKNLLVAIDGYARYVAARPKGCPPYRFVIVGGGPMAADILERVTRLGLTHLVDIVGPISGVESSALYYAHAKALIMASSHNEQWGLVVNEAMACGCPVLVSSAVGCVPDLVDHRVTGFLFAPNDVLAIADLLGEIHDLPESAESAARRARERVEAYSPAALAAEVSRVLSAAGVPL